MDDIEKLVSDLSREAEPVRTAPHPYRLGLGLAGAGCAYLVLLLLVSGLRADLAQAAGHPLYPAELLALALVFCSATLSAALLAFPDLHQKRMLAIAPAGMFAVLWGVIVAAWYADRPPAPLPVHSYQCTLSIALVAVPPAIWTFLVLRRYASTHYAWAGGVAILSAFSLGALWLRLYEVNDSIRHVIEWHYLPMIVMAMLGVALGKLLLRW